MRARMEKLSAFVLRRAGYGFEDMLREKERGNPKFAFLFQGQPFYGVYRALSRPPLPAAVAPVFAHLMANLNGSAGSTQAAGAWIAHAVANAPPKLTTPSSAGPAAHAAHIAVCIAVALCEHCVRARASSAVGGGARQLHTLYVVNDGLFRLRSRPDFAPQCQCFRAAIQPHLQNMVRAAVDAGSGNAVAKVVQVWVDIRAFDDETLSQLAAAVPQAPAAAHPYAAAQQNELQHLLPVSTGIGHGVAPAAVPVGLMASCIKMAVGSGKLRWSPVDYAMLAHVPPSVEPGRLDARVAAFYSQLSQELQAD